MKKIAVGLLAALVTLSALATAAEARGRIGSHRVGGSNSAGKGSHYVGGH